MAEHDHITFGETNDPALGLIKYSVTATINAICPRCGNPDCAEIEEFKERLKAQLFEASDVRLK